MKKIVLILLVLFLVFGVTISAKSLQPTALAPENVQWLIHLHVKKFVSTQLFDLLMGDQKDKIVKFNDMMAERFKIDFFKDVNGITILGMGKDKENAVLCWDGKIDKEFILALLKLNEDYKEIPYGKYTIHSWEGDHFGTFANEHVALVGEDEDAIKNVLDTIAGKKRSMTASHLMTYWKGIPQDAFLKAAASNIAELAHDREASAILKKTGMAFFMALERNENLKLKLKLTTDTPETAKNIHQVVMGFMALAKLKQNDKASHKHMKFLELMAHLTINVEKNVVQMELNYPSKDLAEMFSHARIGF
ncbi:MAG: hypothetical protein JSV88_08000 [Candidatus Aminicenantes bacterium]|nr:MAG: hypothetical protein JSV88_08000 [Candidatus Aminicenantes bacterium]